MLVAPEAAAFNCLLHQRPIARRSRVGLLGECQKHCTLRRSHAPGLGELMIILDTVTCWGIVGRQCYCTGGLFQLICMSSVGLLRCAVTVAKRCKIGLWCSQRLNTNAGSAFRLVFQLKTDYRCNCPQWPPIYGAKTSQFKLWQNGARYGNILLMSITSIWSTFN